MSSFPEVVLQRFNPEENFFVTPEDTLETKCAMLSKNIPGSFKNISLDVFSNILASVSNIKEWVLIVEKGQNEITEYNKSDVKAVIERDIRSRFERIGKNPNIFDHQLRKYLLNYVFADALENSSEEERYELIDIMTKQHATALKKIDTTFNRAVINCRLKLAHFINSLALKVIVGIAVFGLLTYFGLVYGVGFGIKIIVYISKLIFSSIISKIGLMAYGSILSFSLISYALRNKYPKMYNITRTIFVNIGNVFRFIFITPIILPFSLVLLLSGVFSFGTFAVHDHVSKISVKISESAKKDFINVKMDQARNIFIDVLTKADCALTEIIDKTRQRVFAMPTLNQLAKA